MSLEEWKSLLEWGGVVLLALTVFSGAGALLVNNRINSRQSEELRNFQLKVEEEQQRTARAQKDAAHAQLALGQALTAFAKRSGDRVLNFSSFVESLKGQPVKTIEVWYNPGDAEAERLSNDLLRALQEASWPVSTRELHPDDRLGGLSLAKQRGIFVLSRHIEDASSFSMLIFRSLFFGGGGACTTAGDIPDNKIVVLIGERDRL